MGAAFFLKYWKTFAIIAAALVAFVYVYDKGVSAERARANRAELVAERQAREFETLRNKLANSISKTLQESTRVNDEKLANDLYSLSAGTMRLRDPKPAACVPTTAGNPREHPTAPACELSGEASGFLLSEAHRADNIAEQLAACQNVLLMERGMSNADASATD